MKEQLTEAEILKIEQFCLDEEMYSAVKKIMLAGIYTHGTVQAGFTPNPLQNGALNLAALATENPITDELLGQHIRGFWSGINALENAFKALSTIKSSKNEDVVTPYNEAI